MMRRGVPLLLTASVALASLAGCTASASNMPQCTTADENLFILMAQTVPSATQLPCVAELPAGWTFGGSLVQSGLTRFWLDSDRAGIHAVEIDLTRTCNTSEGVATPPGPDEVNMDVFLVPGLPPAFTATRFAVFDGGCVTYRYRFGGEAPPSLTVEAQEALSFLSRRLIVREVEVDFGLSLCGAFAKACAS